MNAILRHITLFLLLLALTACDGDSITPPSPSVTEGTPITVVTKAFFPDMAKGSAPSRALGEAPTMTELLNELNVNLFVFDPSGVMLQFIGPEDISVLRIDEATHTVHFKVSNIYSSSQPRRLHFVITSAPDLHTVPGGEYITAMAGETTTMPALIVGDNTDAYWGILEVPGITDNMSVHVKLIRNFVKLTVKSTAEPSQFKILGYTVVNRPSAGTVAPYIYRDHLFASFLDPDNVLLDYEEIISQGYHGVNPAGTDRNMTHTEPEEVQASLDESVRRLAAGEADTPYYFYERTQSGMTSAGSDVRVTYTIVYGEYRGKRSYYKIDIGYDKDGNFAFYDLLRNFQYEINITEVGGDGAPTLIDAMLGAANNNLSASVVTRDLFAIGYEGERIEVSATRVVFTEKTTDYKFRFRYTTPKGEVFDATKLRIFDLGNPGTEFDVSGVTATNSKTISLPGDVIENARLTLGADNWYNFEITTKNIPSDSRRYEQNIRFYYRGGTAGLGRSVTFMLRRPWEFTNISATTPGSAVKSPLSISFNVPSGLSSALFPLILIFESDKQNIYAKNGSALTVATGRSDFRGATTDTVIKYEWRLEWADYCDEAGNEGGTYTAEFMMNTTAADDRTCNTDGIDAANNGTRSTNNGTESFCVRIANKGQKYLEPIYVNVSRN